MKKQRVALISGITGQDGSYLAELLLGKGYKVHGIMRRTSSFNTHRIDHIYDYPNLKLHFGDMTDSFSIDNLIRELQPDELYHLAAQSHVHVSFELPKYTAEVDAIGTLNLLEGIRKYSPKTKLYNACTSELFGKVQETPQRETTPFYPRSPYGVAKLYSYWISKNYREAYDLFVACGILFNHECVVEDTPFIIKDKKEIIILSIKEIAEKYANLDFNTNITKLGTKLNKNIQVWDKHGWTDIKYLSCNKDNNKIPYLINTRNGSFIASNNHSAINEENKKINVENLKINDKLSLIDNFPLSTNYDTTFNENEAQLLGFIIGDGTFFGGNIELTNKKLELLKKYEDIWLKIGGEKVKYRKKRSGYTKRKDINGMFLIGETCINRHKIYDSNKFKIIPTEILNSPENIMLAFLNGYNDADGLKGNGKKFYSFKTNSQTLASQLVYLIQNTTKQEISLYVDKNPNKENKFYYTINLKSNSLHPQNHKNTKEKYNKILNLIKEGYSARKIERDFGLSRQLVSKIKHGYVPTFTNSFEKSSNEIIKKEKLENYNNWYFDLETNSGTFNCGVGFSHIHNSERRGHTFVTRKITLGLSKLANSYQLVNDKKQIFPSLSLGNLYSKRDWGYAPDYVEGMWRMLQQETGEDYILSTGETHSIKEFIDECIMYTPFVGKTKWVGEDLDEKLMYDNVELVSINPRYYRPTEVDLLIGDNFKAKTELGWEPTTTFKELARKMMKHDLENESE